MRTIILDGLFFLVLFVLASIGSLCLVGWIGEWICKKAESNRRKKEARIINAVINEMKRRNGEEKE